MREILSKAADIISKKGWCQNDYSRPNGAVCASRAINDAAGGLAHAHEAREAFLKFIGRDSIAVWNDSKGQTKEKVIATLRDAAEA